MNNNHMILLASKFMHEIKNFEKDPHGFVNCEPAYKLAVLNDIGEILAGGSITSKTFFDLMDKEKENPQKELFYKPSNLLEANNITFERKSYRDPNNLLVPGNFYFHPRLQITPPIPVLDISDDGTISASYEDEIFYLEMIDKLTKKELVDYFYLKTNSFAPEATLARDMGAFDHMLRFWDVDFILYLIDEAFACSLDSGGQLPKNPLAIQAFEVEALLVYEARKRICYEEGLDRVLPRPIS